MHVTWIDKPDDNLSIEDDQEVLKVQRVQTPTYVAIEKLDNCLKQMEYRLKKAKREGLCKIDASSSDIFDILKLSIKPGFKQVGHKKETRDCKGGNLREKGLN